MWIPVQAARNSLAICGFGRGSMTIVIDGYSAPITAGNFLDLVNRGFYNGMVRIATPSSSWGRGGACFRGARLCRCLKLCTRCCLSGKHISPESHFEVQLPPDSWLQDLNFRPPVSMPRNHHPFTILHAILCFCRRCREQMDLLFRLVTQRARYASPHTAAVLQPQLK